jgi:hypothetical protein
MRASMRWFVYVAIIPTALIASTMDAYAGAAGGGSAAVSVANAVHSAGEVTSLLNQYNELMDQYDKEVLAEKKRVLFKKAQNILTELIEQANDVESEISILTKKKLNRVYSNKLNRVLKNVRQMRMTAQKRMKATVKSG